MLQIREKSGILSPDRPAHSHADYHTLAPMYVYMYMCMYLPMYYVLLYVYMHASLYVYLNIYIYIYIYIYMDELRMYTAALLC